MKKKDRHETMKEEENGVFENKSRPTSLKNNFFVNNNQLSPPMIT